MLIPFTYPWIIRLHFSDGKKIIDLGAGDGTFMKTVNFDNKYDVLGVELFDPYIKKAKKTKAYKDVIKGDVTKLPSFNKKFEIVHASQVIEHLTRDKAMKFLLKCDNLSSNKIIIGTPNGHIHQEAYDHNIHQEHHSAWRTEDFKNLKYKVYGQGLKLVYGENGLLQKKIAQNTLVKSCLFALSYIFSPLVYFFPNFAAHLIAVKQK